MTAKKGRGPSLERAGHEGVTKKSLESRPAISRKRPNLCVWRGIQTQTPHPIQIPCSECRRFAVAGGHIAAADEQLEGGR